MQMKVTCPKCKSEYIVDTTKKKVYCGTCDIEYKVTSVKVFFYSDNSVQVVSEYESINSEYNFVEEQNLRVECETRKILYNRMITSPRSDRKTIFEMLAHHRAVCPLCIEINKIRDEK